MSDIRPFTIAVPDADIDDLRRRLAATRWPEAEAVDDLTQGIPLAYVQEVCQYWRDDYDWRRCEAGLNAHPNHIVEIDGLDIHFQHVRSPHDDATPLVLTHGWPGSIVEFQKVIGPLTDPTAHGGTLTTRSTSSSRRFPATGGAASRRPPGGASNGSPRPGTS